jgi:hypothetical protein
MEFVINHTRRQIRQLTNLSDLDIETFLIDNDWEGSDDADIMILHEDTTCAFERVVALIEDENYDIPDDIRGIFIFDQSALSEAYDAEYVEEGPTYEFLGWDNPGASFDW